MILSSFSFIFVFLPFTVLTYHLLLRAGWVTSAKTFLIAVSLLFYSIWKLSFLPLFVGSILVNFGFARWIASIPERPKRKWIFYSAVFLNLGLLVYFKYLGFFMGELNRAFGFGFTIEKLMLPLGISFFTFQQIGYLMDVYSAKELKHQFIDYCLFVSFFPQLISGPIVLQKEVMSQYTQLGERKFSAESFAKGIFLFSIGLFKKVMIADALAYAVSIGFDREMEPNILRSWSACIGFMFQLYFDFSGYMDMTLGVCMMLNIQLPGNFNSPFRAPNISEFWQRWHITMTRFLMSTIYNPLAMGGTRRSLHGRYSAIPKFIVTVAVPVLITFIIAGVWHGAGWNFLLFGLLHGIGLVVHRIWQVLGFRMPVWIGRILNMAFFALSLLLFRSASVEGAGRVLQGMMGRFANSSNEPSEWILNVGIILFALVIAFYPRNSAEMVKRFKPSLTTAAFAIVLILLSISNISKQVEFLYWQF